MLSRMAALMAAEIKQHDWSDAPWRIDRAGHQRAADTNRGAGHLEDRQTDSVRTNVMWVTAQVLGHLDANFDVLEYARACGVGSKPGWIEAGIRTTNGRYDYPGTFEPATEALVTCHVCIGYVVPDAAGTVQRESVAWQGRDVWGPVWVHDECRVGVSTPYDDRLGNGEYESVWDRARP